jgi:hypothetical protein
MPRSADGEERSRQALRRQVTLNPRMALTGDKRPGKADIARCITSRTRIFIANSVRTEIVTAVVPPQFLGERCHENP